MIEAEIHDNSSSNNNKTKPSSAQHRATPRTQHGRRTTRSANLSERVPPEKIYNVRDDATEPGFARKPIILRKHAWEGKNRNESENSHDTHGQDSSHGKKGHKNQHNRKRHGYSTKETTWGRRDKEDNDDSQSHKENSQRRESRQKSAQEKNDDIKEESDSSSESSCAYMNDKESSRPNSAKSDHHQSERRSSRGTAKRIDVLSHPKPVHPFFLDDRRTVYWVDKKPLESNGRTEFVMTPRLEELAKYRKLDNCYIGDRPTPVWEVSDSAKSANSSTRLSHLSQSKPVHQHYKYERSVQTIVSNSAKNAATTPRLATLSTPKPHKMWNNSQDTYREGEFNEPIWMITDGARYGRCPPRVENLAEPKPDHPSYKCEKPVQWPVTENALNSVATLRLQQLARPKSGRLRNDDYDPYRVSIAARSARITPRVTDLALPIPRKVRQKKV